MGGNTPIASQSRGLFTTLPSGLIQMFFFTRSQNLSEHSLVYNSYNLIQDMFRLALWGSLFQYTADIVIENTWCMCFAALFCICLYNLKIVYRAAGASCHDGHTLESRSEVWESLQYLCLKHIVCKCERKSLSASLFQLLSVPQVKCTHLPKSAQKWQCLSWYCLFSDIYLKCSGSTTKGRT